MESCELSGHAERATFFSLTVAGIAITLGGLVLIGWRLGVHSIMSVLPGLAIMKPLVALGFILCGASLWSGAPRPSFVQLTISRVTAMAVILLGSVTLLEYVTGSDLHFDALLFRHTLLKTDIFYPGRMAPSTALAFCLIGIALLFPEVETRRGGRPSEWFAATTALIGFVAALGSTYGVNAGYRVSVFSSMAIHTAVLFVLLGVAVLFARPKRGLVTIVTSHRLGGALARRLLPFVIVSPVLLGCLCLEGQHLGWYATEFGLAIFTSSSVVIFTVVVWTTAGWLNHADLRRQQNEENLRHSEERFSKAFRSSPVPIVITTESDDRYIDVNQAFLTMLEFEREEVIGRTSEELHICAAPEGRAALIDRIGKAGSAPPVELELRTKTGKRRIVQAVPEIISVDETRCILVLTIDVTEARKLEGQFFQAQKLEAVGRLAGGIAHDFNNMLGVIIGYADLLRESLAPLSPSQRHIEQIKKAGYRASELTQQLLAFSRRKVINPKVLDLASIAKNLSSMLTRMIGEDISLVLLSEDGLGSIRADLGQIEQVLMNLAVNARDAMPEGGKIIIETKNADLDQSYGQQQQPEVHPGGYVMLAVSDNGIGMDKETLTRIFEPFFTTKGPGEGTGLGLSTVYGIVTQSKGYIWVYSELRQGTTFRMYFPRVDEPADLIPEQKIEHPSARGTETVLLVEDNDALRELSINLLSGHGYKVLDARNARSAITVSEQYPEAIDLLLTDVIMPDLNGRELAIRLTTSRPAMKALFMSGYPGGLMADHEVYSPEASLLQKPFSKSDLLSKVRSVLEGTVS
jgi:PAS domain S-box-containing protein